MKAVQYIKSVPRYLFVRTLGHRRPGSATGALSCIRMADVDPPALPTPEWMRVRPLLSGICGSDLSTIRAKGSPYFSPLISAPFVLGHEVVGEVEETGSGPGDVSRGRPRGDRTRPLLRRPGYSPSVPVVQSRRFRPVRDGHARRRFPGHTNRVLQGHGRWMEHVPGGHPFQVHRVPGQLSDEEAVLVEPFSCCLHAVLKSFPGDDETVLVIGCGAIGLLTIAAIRALGAKCPILAAARYPHQQTLAAALGADRVIGRDENLYDTVSEVTGAEIHRPEIGRPVFIGGVHRTFDCVGSSRTIDDALRLTGSGGGVTVVGMPGIPAGIDWTAVWYKELKVQGAYAYGTERYEGRSVRTFDLAMDLLASGKIDLKPLVTDLFPLKEYRKAIGRALEAGRHGAVKVAFDLRNEPGS